MNFPVHPHMLRHACGYWMNEKKVPIRHIQEWLGHKNNDECHGKPFPGDRGIQWEPRPETAVDELLEALD